MRTPLGVQVWSAYRWLRRSAPFLAGLGFMALVFWILSGAPERGRARIQELAQEAAESSALDEAALKEAKEMEALGRRTTKLREELDADPRTATAMVFEPPLTDPELASQDQWETECDMCRSCSGDTSEVDDERACMAFCQLGDRGPLVESYEGSGCLCKDGWHRWDRSHCHSSPGFDCTPYGFTKHYDPRFGMLWSWKRPRSWQPGVCRWSRDAPS